MMSTASSGALADVVRLGWASGAALALIKPEVSDTDLLDISATRTVRRDRGVHPTVPGCETAGWPGGAQPT
jgi:hypothetical protein